jgi:Sigma-70 factor, region 1.1
MHSDRTLVPQPDESRMPPPPRRPAAPPASADHDRPGTSAWEKLIVEGKDRGYVTLAEVDAVFEALNVYPPDDVEPAYALLRAMGLEVVVRIEGPEGLT